jgi:hypothetical protein
LVLASDFLNEQELTVVRGGIERDVLMEVLGVSAIARPRTRAGRSEWVSVGIALVLTSDGLNEQELADVCGRDW